MRTHLPKKIDFKISDLIDEITKNINSLDADIAGEDDEIFDLIAIQENLENALEGVQDIRKAKYIY